MTLRRSVRAVPGARAAHPARHTAVAGLLAAGALALAACGSGDSASSGSAGASDGSGGSGSSAEAAPVRDGAAQVAVTLSNGGAKDACALDHATAPAGPVTFTVTNASAPSLTEVELQSDQRILGEKENLAPGLAPVSFTLTLGGGTYQLYCPGAQNETQSFTVTGQASASTTGTAQTVLAQGATDYGVYAASVLDDMKVAVANLKTAVDSGDVEAAKKQYALARPFYEKVESDVEGFVLPGSSPTDNKGNLDYLIDMRESNLDEAVGWSGFHAVERDLWQGGKITDETKKYAADLVTNTAKLAALAGALQYKPEDLANGAAGLLEEVQSNKIKGEEESYSHLDLVDFAANVEGAKQAFANLKPGLQQVDPVLTSDVVKQFALVDTALDAYKDPTALGGYKEWTEQLRTTGAAALSKAVQGLQDPLSRIAEKVATAQ